MQITVEKMKNGQFRATGDDVRFNVKASTVAGALRRAADFLDEVDRILAPEASN